MTRISNVDQVLVLLQEQLRKAGRREPATRVAPTTRDSATTPLERARRLAALEALSDEERRRVLVEGLLADTFGARLAGDPRFPSLAADVARIIGDSDEGARLLEDALAELRSSA